MAQLTDVTGLSDRSGRQLLKQLDGKKTARPAEEILRGSKTAAVGDCVVNTDAAAYRNARRPGEVRASQ